MTYSQASKSVEAKRQSGLISDAEAYRCQSSINRIESSGKYWRQKQELFSVWATP